MFLRPVAARAFAVLAAAMLFQATPLEAAADDPLIVLAGEQVRWEGPSGKEVAASEISAKVAAVLKGRVENQVAETMTAAELAGVVDAIIAAKPDVVVLFMGKSDEKAATKDDTMIASLASAAKKIAGGGARVFIVPSGSSLGAATGANLAIAADRAGATFVETGNVIDRRPYDEAMEAVVEALKEPQKTPVPIKMELPPLEAKPAEPAAPVDTSTPDRAATAAALVSEPAATPTADGGKGATTSTRVVRGEAATIYMPPPRPLKQFDPKDRPVSKKRAPKKPAVAN